MSTDSGKDGLILLILACIVGAAFALIAGRLDLPLRYQFRRSDLEGGMLTPVASMVGYLSLATLLAAGLVPFARKVRSTSGWIAPSATASAVATRR